MADIKEKKGTTWYTIKVQSNHERSVSEKLRLEVEREGLKNVKQILVPLEKNYYIKEGKKLSRDKVIYPGYAFVEVDVIGELQFLLKQIGGNSGLLKDRSGNPIPISQSEIDRMVGTIEDKKISDDNKFIVDEMVTINSGAFSGFKGTIEEINLEKNKVKLSVSIFGRITYMDLDFKQIEKIDE